MSKKNKKKTIREAQQELAQNCGFADDVIWDLLHSNDSQLMKEKIKQLIPDQKKGNKSIEKIRDTIFDSVWAQRKYTNKTSVTYLFYVMVTEKEDFVLDSTEFSCHPVFRCKKCDNGSNSKDCCMIFVDETGRVYQNWKSFVEENVLPAGTMVAPRKGIYNFNKSNEVILDIYTTPNGTTGAKVMSAAKTGSALLGIGAACVPIAAMVMPVAGAVLVASEVISVGVGAFNSITSAWNLVDRKKHEQSISIKNSEARSSYIGVASGAAGVASAGATSVMTSKAAVGKATGGLEVLVNSINITSIILSGSGVADGVLDLIFKCDDEIEISALDVLQLSASLVLFTHSVYNFQLASQITNEARTNSIKAYRDTLSKHQRKIFDKMSKETVRIRGITQGKMDIIRGVNEIPDRQYLNDLFRVNRQLNRRKVRPAFAPSGKGVVLNNEVKVDTGVLRQSIKNQQGPKVLDHVSRPIPSTYNSETYTTQVPREVHLLFSNGITEQNVDTKVLALLNELFSFPIDKDQDPLNDIKKESKNPVIILDNLAIALPNGDIISLREYGQQFLKKIADCYKFQDVILSMAKNFPEKTFKHLLRLAQVFIENELGDIQRILKLFIPTESVLYRILKHVLDNNFCFDYDYISERSAKILDAVKKYYISLNPNNNLSSTKKCPDCGGRFYVCDE